MLGADQPGLAAIHQQQRRLVIRHVGLHRADDARCRRSQLGRARENLADFDAALAVFLNLNGEGTPRRSCARSAGSASAAPCRRIWPAPAWDRTYRRATAAVHEQMDDVLGLGRKVRVPRERAGWCRRGGCGLTIGALAEECCRAHAPDPSASAEQIAPAQQAVGLDCLMMRHIASFNLM